MDKIYVSRHVCLVDEENLGVAVAPRDLVGADEGGIAYLSERFQGRKIDVAVFRDGAKVKNGDFHVPIVTDFRKIDKSSVRAIVFCMIHRKIFKKQLTGVKF